MGKFIDVFYHLQLKCVRFWGKKRCMACILPSEEKSGGKIHDMLLFSLTVNPPRQTAVLSHSCYSPASPGAVCSLGREELQEDLTEEGVVGSGEGLCAESFQSSPKPLLTSTI